MPGELQGWRFRVEPAPGGVRVIASTAGASRCMAGLPGVPEAAVSLGNAAVLLLLAVLAGAAFWRGYFWVGLILLALLSGMGLLL